MALKNTKNIRKVTVLYFFSYICISFLLLLLFVLYRGKEKIHSKIKFIVY